MADETEVVLTGPAKLRGAFKKPGETITVTPTERAQLLAAGVIAPDAPAADPEIVVDDPPQAAKTTRKAGSGKAKV
ncbi:hypothetical protein CKO11_06945 [Rhodobacter sp. TJ_12]|uniref:DUF7210 family protein n=1 Tax=Rhodobacter sp. TJ_12 TaxID=2029399 RepID=UPI001CC1A288|nr:hypothetical protein [Rhodobacter sp. TJ_12]MBZ4022192.1 hypothetical protein [Rhodobacter sp. TJ_12]